MGAFLRLMLPYTLISLLLLAAWILFLCRKMNFGDSQSTFLPEDSAVHPMNRSRILMYAALFAVCLMTVVRILSYPVMLLTVLLAVLITDRHTLRQVDYSLLLSLRGILCLYRKSRPYSRFLQIDCRASSPDTKFLLPLLASPADHEQRSGSHFCSPALLRMCRRQDRSAQISAVSEL